MRMLGLFFISAITLVAGGNTHQEYLKDDLGNSNFIEYVASISVPDYSVLDEKK